MTLDLTMPKIPRIRHLLPAWLSLLLVPVVAAAALDASPDESLRLVGIGVLCAVIMMGQLLVAYELYQGREREAALAREAATDPLTGLGNRRALDEAMTREVLRSARTGRPATLVMLDLDAFKAVNDRYGHSVGDTMLRAFAAVLEAHTRLGLDGLYRLGGDEFVVLMAETGARDAERVAERIRAAFLPMAARLAPEVAVDCSVGISELAESEDGDTGQWLAVADQRMYAAKGRELTLD